MVIQNCRLPQIELPTVEILDDDDNKILAAFEVILDGYKRAQKRTRAITKAYSELQSITLSILKKYEDGGTPSKKENDKCLLDNIGIKYRSPISETPHSKKAVSDRGRGDVGMIDLTTLFSKLDEPIESATCDKSPEMFAETCERSPAKQLSPRMEFPQSNSKRKLDMGAEAGPSRATRVSIGKTVKNDLDNGENIPPLSERNVNSNDTFLSQHESRPPAKIGLAKAIYNIEKRKTPSGKSMKQSILVFQPITTKTDLALPEKPAINKPDVPYRGSNLFEEDYQTKKKKSDAIVDRSCTSANHSYRRDEETFTNFTGIPEVAAREKKDSKRNGESATHNEVSLVIPSASQIDETARSLFDDEDIDNFPTSPDILNTCVESPDITVLSQPNANTDFPSTPKNLGPVASTSKTPQFHHPMESMDETFFAPAEKMALISNVDRKLPADATKIDENKNPPTNIRSVKRKADEESFDTEKEFEDLALQDINWDAEITDEEWTSPNRLSKNSFDFPPEKGKKSSQHGHKGKVERNKAKRSKLAGWACWQCEKYYGNMDLSEAELKKRIDMCSRHRSKDNPRYFTPKGFWNPEFPETSDSSDCGENEAFHTR